MAFIYDRIVRFQDTDAAGVVFFSNLLSICHEAYEEMLRGRGIDLKLFFQHPDFALPIVHAEVDFYQPVFCGDRLAVCVLPERLGTDKFKLVYQIDRGSREGAAVGPVAQAFTVHLCIHPQTRQRQALPVLLQDFF